MSPHRGLLFVALVLAGACGPPPPERPTRPAGERTEPNVLYVLWDAQRASSTSVHGYDRPTTPFLDSIADECAIFDRAHSQSPATISSMMTTFTGTYPQNHNTGWKGVDGRIVSTAPPPETYVSMAEVCQRAGLWTEAWVGNPWLTADSGIQDGFDRYVCLDGYANTEEVTAGVLEAIDALGGEGWFLYAHYIDPHAPFDPPDPWRDAFESAEYDGPVDAWDIGRMREGKIDWGEDEIAHMRDLYDAEVRYMDLQVERLFAKLREEGILDDTLVVVTADHGEELGDHGSWEHGVLYEECLHIPFVVRFPHGEHAGRYDMLVETLDIYPTVAEFLGQPVPDHVQGRSLQAQMRGAWRRPISYARYPARQFQSFLFDDGRKLILPEPAAKPPPRPVVPELFDLAADPLERENLADDDPQAVAALTNVAMDWRDAIRQEPPERMQELEREGANLEALMALGYLGGDAMAEVEAVAERFSRVLVFGIDGATWDVIDPMIERGELPHLAGLVRRGVRAPLASLEDFRQSVRIWTSIVTGVVPERHGVVDFVTWNEALGASVPISSDHRRVPALWNLADAAGLSIGVIGCWATWPAERLSVPGSYIVSDKILTETKTDVTWPPDLLDLDALGDDLALPTAFTDRFAGVYDWSSGRLLRPELAALEDGLRTTRFLLRQDLVKLGSGLELGRRLDPDVTFNYVRLVDAVQHFFWPDDAIGGWVFPDELDPRAIVGEAYRQADAALGAYLDAVREDAHVIVLSDHGATHKADPVGVKADRRTGVYLGLGGEAVVDERWFRRLGVHVLVEGRDEGGVVAPEDLEATKERLREKLLAIRTRSGAPALIQLPRDLEAGEEDLLFTWNVWELRPDTEIEVGGTWYQLADIAELTVRTGEHERDGILVAAGPAFREGVALESASVLDVLPTLAVLLGLPVAEDLDGAPLLEAFAPEFLERRPVRRVATYGGRRAEGTAGEPVLDPEVMRSLEALGYLQGPRDG